MSSSTKRRTETAKVSASVKCPHCGEIFWQDEERTITTVEQVYDTRWDCICGLG